LAVIVSLQDALGVMHVLCILPLHFKFTGCISMIAAAELREGVSEKENRRIP
jgi:hypothetical protein